MSIVDLATANSYYRATMFLSVLYHSSKKSVQISNHAFLLGSVIQKGIDFFEEQSKTESVKELLLDFLLWIFCLLSNDSCLFRSTTIGKQWI